jgi:glycosyltransferase involved in cell wall biosynthesis
MATLPCSVVVPTYNRAKSLRRLLDSLTTQDISRHDFEVIVVDDGSSDETWQELGQVETPYRLRPLWQRNQGPAAARNAAIRVAEGELIVFVDDDVIAAPDLLRRHIEAHETGQSVVVIGLMALAEGARLSPWAEWESYALYKQYEAMQEGRWAPTPRQFYTANASVKRADLIETGLFDPLFRRAEDVELAYRLRDLGLSFRFLPGAVAYHRPGRTYGAWKRMAEQYGYYDVLMWQEKGRAHIIRVIGHEFVHQRHPALQRASRHLVGHRWRLALATTTAGATAQVASWLRFKRGARAAYSVIFNLLYYQGVCDALAGRDAFWPSLELWREPEPGTLAAAGSER